MCDNIERRNFKISLVSNNNVVCESIFDAECYNHLTRYNIDVRKEFYWYINNIKSILSSDVVKGDFYGYPMIYNNFDKKYNHKFKLVLYNEDNIVIEREFISNYNLVNLFSSDLIEYLKFIVSDISKAIRNADINMMWEDYDLINRFNLDIRDVRNLTKDERINKLQKIYK